MTKNLCTLSVSKIHGRSETHPLCIVPVNLYFRPGLVKVSDLGKIMTAGFAEALIAVSTESQVPETQRTLWPDGSVRFTQADVWLRDQHGENSIKVVLSDLDSPRATATEIEETVERLKEIRSYMPPKMNLPPGFSKDISPVFMRKLAKPSQSFSIGWGSEEFSIFGNLLPFNKTLLTQDWLSRSELSGGRWLELFLRFREGSSFVEFWGQVGWNDHDDPSPSKDLPELWIATKGLFLNMDFQEEKVDSYATGDDKVFLSKSGNWNDGQTVTFHGIISEGMENIPPVVWQNDASAHGAFGWIHDAIPAFQAVDSAEKWAASELSKLTKNDPWQAGFWVPTEPGQTGDHAGFGVSGPSAAIYYRSNSAINLMRFACYQEGCRPIWRRRFGKIMTDSDYRNAGVLMWDERPHPAGNLLGKNGPPDIYTGGMRSSKGQIWWGMDRQHGEDVAWITYLTLVNDPLIRRMAMDRAETWMAALRVDTGNTSIDGTDTGRGARLLGMLCRYAGIVKDPRIEQRIRERVQLYARSIYLEGPAPVTATVSKVVPQQVYDPSNQAGGLPVPHWRPWEDAIAAYVLTLAYGVTGDPMALASAQALATNIVLHGFERMADGTHRLYVALAYNSGDPLNEEQLKDPNLAKNSEGTGYHLWSHPSLVIAWNTSIMQGEVNPDARQKAKSVMDLAAPLVSELYLSTKNVFMSPWENYEVAGENSEWVSLTPLPAPDWYTNSFN